MIQKNVQQSDYCESTFYENSITLYYSLSNKDFNFEYCVGVFC